MKTSALARAVALAVVAMLPVALWAHAAVADPSPPRTMIDTVGVVCASDIGPDESGPGSVNQDWWVSALVDLEYVEELPGSDSWRGSRFIAGTIRDVKGEVIGNGPAVLSEVFDTSARLQEDGNILVTGSASVYVAEPPWYRVHSCAQTTGPSGFGKIPR